MKPTRITLRQLTLLLFGLMLLFSCEQDVTFDVANGETKLFAFSEITTDQKIKVQVNTAVGINTEDDFHFPKQADAQVVLLRDGVELNDPGFRYISREKAFVSQGAFTPEVGVEYSLKVSLKNNTDIQPIIGSTTIPSPQILENVFLKKFSETQVNPKQKEISLSLDVDFEGMEAPYYIIKPYILDQNGEKIELLISHIHSGAIAATYSKSNNGVLIDTHKLTERLGLTLTNDAYIKKDISIGQVYFELHTITKQGYSYYKATTRQVDAQSSAVSEPVISYTNFDKGLGLFTGYSASITTINL